MRWWVGAGSLLCLALSGCLQGPAALDGATRHCGPVDASSLALPLLGRTSSGIVGLATDPTQPWDALLLAQSAVKAQLGPTTTPPGWTVTVTDLTRNATERTLMQVRLAPMGAQAAGGDVGFGWSFSQPGCDTTRRISAATLLGAPAPGEVARPGKGVHVFTAGFWENGTLFYTNIPGLDEAKAWPHAGWYAWEGGDPLPVYVYDRAPDERPAYWSATVPTRIAPGLPATPGGGTSVWEYFPTIAGFNEALKGLSSHTARVVWIPPEKAYTTERAKAQGHPLYGDALVFYIAVVDVVDLPCQTSAPMSVLTGGIVSAALPPCDLPK